MQFDHRIDQTQTQTIAGVFAAAGLNTIEALQDFFALGRQYTGTGISYIDNDLPLLLPQAHTNRALARRVFDCIVNEIGDRLKQQVAITVKMGHRCQVHLKCLRFVRRQRLIKLDHIEQNYLQVNISKTGTRVAGLNLCDPE